MNKIFVDTSAWIMLLNKDEERHLEAVDIYLNKLQGFVLVISNLVLGETYTWLRKKAGFKSSIDFLVSIKEKKSPGKFELIYSTPDIEEEAFQILKKYSDQDFSYADAVTFAIMRKERIKEAFAYDNHFNTAGFNTIPGSKL